ncbi:hypothetical protein RUMHYD_03817 [Blautia hydrogenotrophica DSM 10507]|uniref:Uncharacterized protein n=1 Tax=Blautia hydrogenotrophica (strain DSM 10507 / JCM 14656 / S5a33) TaxID=476272 RepID=C0CSF0_BLAHS|nr:hypothetical protein RUMHYD_03817 [Blautia hydrogenotrophica DSM 10507]
MSKTVALATISTQCGFTNGAGRIVTIMEVRQRESLDILQRTA